MDKPKKPHPDFPLTPHVSKRWCKKINRKMYYFGTWTDPDAALREYLSIKEELQAGIDPRRQVVRGCTVGDAANLWLGQKLAALEAKTLSPESYRDYKAAAVLVIEQFGRQTPCIGLLPGDFSTLRNQLSTKYAPSRMNKLVTSVRMLFTWCDQSGHLDAPVRFGPDFKGASKLQKRQARLNTAKKLFTATEIRSILEAASPQLRAMAYLGINCGLGNTDIGRLKHGDIQNGILCLPRAKTGIDRRIPLWKETIQALAEVKSHRPKAKSPSEEGLVFLTKGGNPWSEFGNDELAKQFAKLLKKIGLYKERRTFYALRHTFQTIGDESKDPIAVQYLMGHSDHSMGDVYRESISDGRIKGVLDHIHKWLTRDGLPDSSSLGLFAAFLRPPSAG